MIYVTFDTSELEDFAANFDNAIKKSMNKAMAALAAQTQKYIVEQANQKLHSTKDMYLENLDRFQDDNGNWIISLDASVVWIDDGAPEWDMKPFFLKSTKAKTNKKGEKYLIVPFEHNKNKKNMNFSQRDLLSAIKSELSSIGVDLNKIETNKSGTPKLGLVRSLDITNRPNKIGEGPGMGSGRLGDVRQGSSGTPFLKGIRIYQNKVKDKKGNENIQKSVMTFRTVSENNKNINAWRHPAVEGKHIFEDAAKWALNEFDTKILPFLVSEISKST